METLRSWALSAACCLLIAASLLVAGLQLRGLLRRLPPPPARPAPLPAFGQADLVYFSEPTCPACQKATPRLLALERRYPRYRFAHVDAGTPAGDALQQQYYQAYRVPKRDRGFIPILFAGRRYFLGTDGVGQALPAFLAAGPLPAPPRTPLPASSPPPGPNASAR